LGAQSNPTRDLTGQELDHKYQVLEMIGYGGMAHVYRGVQQPLGRNVAIKVIPTHADSGVDKRFVDLFYTEARVVANLNHGHIVPVYDFGEDKGWAYLVMEYIPGKTLREHIVRGEQQGTRMELARALELIAQAAQALDYAHEHGVIHRDVKPGNMLMRSDDYLLLSDFGIATMLEANSTFAHSGHNAGTPQYMAPEQSIPNGIVDGRTDIYALGVVLFQCVTGRLPFVAESPVAVALKHQQEPPPRPSSLVLGVPAAVDAIILKALAKDPRGRFQRAKEMADQLSATAAEVRSPRRNAAPTSPIQPGSAQGALVPVPHVETAAVVCGRCGARNLPQNHYCTSCGFELLASSVPVDGPLVGQSNGQKCRLTLRNGVLSGTAFVLQKTTTIGRMHGNDIVIPDPTISRHHARLMLRGSNWYVEDNKSRNGTYINGSRVTSESLLHHGDQLRFGDDVLAFELVG